MGCAESIPVSDQDLARPHHRVDQNNAPLVTATIAPSQHQPLVLFMPQKARSRHGKHQYDILLPNGIPFHGVTIRGHTGERCKFSVWDSNNHLLAACLVVRTAGALYKIYIPQAVFPGQSPSKQEYNGKQLFIYAEVTARQVTLNNEEDDSTKSDSTPEFTVHGTSSRRVLKRAGVIAATIEVEKCGRKRHRKISMCSGIDPILLLCLTGIYDYKDWSEE